MPHAFYYSPVIAQLLTPFRLLPFTVFYGMIASVNLAALWWLVGRWAPVALLFPPVAIEFGVANINLWITVAITLALTGRPAAWALPLLTKVAPGIGMLWHGLRGEWRELAVAIAFTTAVASISFVTAPATWNSWFELLQSNMGMAPPQGAIPIPLIYRLPLAVGVIVAGARTNRVWLVPVATVLAIPVLWPSLWVLLAACFRLAKVVGPVDRHRAHQRPPGD
jgi:hypothetical protein